MNFTIEGDFAKQLTVLLKKDAALARAMAQEWLSKIELNTLHAYLVSQDAATELLMQLLQKAPKKTLEDLEKLAKGKTPKPAKKVGRPRKKASPKKKRGPGRPKKKRGPGRPRKAVAKPKAGKRIRLTAEQVQAAKEKILKLLGSQTWGTRKELVEAAALPTQAAYRRIVVELMDAGKILAKGERSKRVYGLKKGKRRKGKGKK